MKVSSKVIWCTRKCSIVLFKIELYWHFIISYSVYRFSFSRQCLNIFICFESISHILDSKYDNLSHFSDKTLISYMITSFIIHMKHVPLHITFRPMMDIISVEEYANQKLRILNNISFSWWTKYTYETWWYFSPKYQHDKSVSNTMHIIWIICSLIDI